MRRISVALFVLFFSVSVYAIAPLIIWIGETAATVTAQTIALDVVTRGFSANDPYVPSRATIPTSNVPAAFRAKGKIGINPYWAAFALAMGLYYEGNQFKMKEEVGGYLWSVNSSYAVQPNIMIGEPDVTGLLAILPSDKITKIVEIIPPTTIPIPFNCNFSSEYPSIPCTTGYYIKVKRLVYSQTSETWSEADAQYSLFRSVEPVPLGVQEIPKTDAEIATMAAGYLSTENRPKEAFADVSGNPIPDMFANADIVPKSSIDSATASDLDAYRQGLLQTTDPSADHYVTPERYDYIKNLAAQQDYENSDEGRADALNEKMKQPITQAQYEESNKKYADAVNAITDALPSNENNESDIDDSFNKLDEIITDIPNATLPSPANIQLPNYSECMTLSLTDGNGHNLVFPSGKQCEKINEMKRMFGYFLALAVAFALCWQLLNRPHG